ncbi:PREDICTED: uncharacterized protein LOC105963438 [Erythranthe guttata]|nr:PREDICTED: uncharacterized protein LOC105963438 [Erythranthe guttata]|eukprot:XP_012843296.1 PREDICTED: uncharacterized protein LOC105963438 [Erythranthe guttata]
MSPCRLYSSIFTHTAKPRAKTKKIDRRFTMDRELEEMQFLGLFGIYAEAYKLIFKLRKIFTQITLALILPLSLIFLGHEKISEVLYWRIRYTEYKLHRTPAGTPRFDSLSDLVSSEWSLYVLFKAVYVTSLLVLALLATSAVVYTVACVYTNREITFKKVMSVVPKVWKRLMVTFLCTYLGFFAYNVAFAVTLYLWFVTLCEVSIVGPVVLWIIFVSYAIGFVYVSVIWQLASVVTVLEDSCGFKAMIKSKNLIKGKILVSILIFFKLNLSLGVIDSYFRMYVVYEWFEIGIIKVIGIGVLCFLLLLKLILFVLVVQTVIYFVCKSLHHENVDKSALSDYLEGYFGDYVPLKAKDVQLEEYHL